ncbi:glutamate-1-semialdehyde 2,1-aminomutase [Candidatus Poribacteria bacterium]|jgi:glutamate-1-semialdehyde 2,1-aminomutase|nr:glutamate-1-semialdehyde 2,1-aminomutase [Candidatus Poribacteria bacterium]|tara:strand:+ start:515 stop:1819 length:1305 start_codon:yes stop_codon:yes gene_type:complete
MIVSQPIRQSKISDKEWESAQKLIPGGVNSPVRAFRSVGGSPPFISSAKGSSIIDVDGNSYIDYIGSWGPMILGHSNETVLSALQKTMQNGTSYGAPTPLETQLAELIISAVPSIEMVRMVNSGTEATMSAIRLARGYTKRDKIIKVEGCYHGHADYLLAKAGSGITTFGLSDSAGVPEDFAKLTLTVPFNNAEAVRKAIKDNSDDVSCIILEPITGNMGVIPPRDGYLQELREITEENGVLLIFDEVMSGFRVSYGGAQELYDVNPDITCLGKIIGGGLPVGAYGGRREIMSKVAPVGEVYQAGTLSGNPLAMAAGIATLTALKSPNFYETLGNISSILAEGIKDISHKYQIPSYHSRVGSMLSCFFTDQVVTDFTSAKTSDTDRFAQFFWGLLNQGVYIAPSQFEAAFVSIAHTEKDIETTISAVDRVLSNF